MKDANSLFLSIAAVVLAIAPAAGGAVETDKATGLLKNPGWEQVRANCGGCHSHALVTSQRADRQTWLDIIRWMQATQNLWQFTPEIEAQILDYLATSYAPQPKRRRAPIPPSLMPPAKSAG